MMDRREAGVTRMPGSAAVNGRGAACFLLVKDGAGEALFHEDLDYVKCLALMNKAVTCYGSLLHAYVLLPGSVQLLVSAPDPVSVDRATASLKRDYAAYYNLAYRRVRRLLIPVHAAIPVDEDDQALVYYRYIEQLPVRAGLAAGPAGYPWSSHACNALGEDAALLIPHAAYLALGREARARRRSYRGLFEPSCWQAGSSGSRLPA